MTPLSDDARARLNAMFAVHDRARAERLLETECGSNLPLMADATEHALDRIRIAAIRMSGGELSRLHDAVALAKIDWRDLLLAAGFGDPDAHLAWVPRPLSPVVTGLRALEPKPRYLVALDTGTEVEVYERALSRR